MPFGHDYETTKREYKEAWLEGWAEGWRIAMLPPKERAEYEAKKKAEERAEFWGLMICLSIALLMLAGIFVPIILWGKK